MAGRHSAPSPVGVFFADAGGVGEGAARAQTVALNSLAIMAGHGVAGAVPRFGTRILMQGLRCCVVAGLGVSGMRVPSVY